MENITETTNKKRNGKKRVYTVVCVVLAAVCLGCIAWIIRYAVGLNRAEDKMDGILESYVISAGEAAGAESVGGQDLSGADSKAAGQDLSGAASEAAGQDLSGTALEATGQDSSDTEDLLPGYELPYNSVDIKALQEKENKDIYAWICVPGTAVDYPVLQHPEQMDYYLEYNIDGTKGYPGCIYTQRMNSKDWTDKNTVLYGHNMKNGTMFAGLHHYEDSEFFEENPYIYIYTEDDRILVYQIFAAYEYSDAHLLMTVSTGTDENYQTYLDSIFENDGLNDHFNHELELTPQDKIITLSTCISSKPTRRWLVQGVLIEEGDQVAED